MSKSGTIGRRARGRRMKTTIQRVLPLGLLRCCTETQLRSGQRKCASLQNVSVRQYGGPRKRYRLGL